MITAAQIESIIAEIRSISDVFLIDTAALYSYTGDSITNGEPIKQYTAPTTIRCRLITRSGTEKMNIAAQERLVSKSQYYGQYRLQVEPDLVVTVNDKIVFQNRTFLIEYIPPDHAFAGSKVIGLQEII